MSDELTAAELSGFRRKLDALRGDIQALAAAGSDATGTVELDQARVGRLSRMDALQAQAMSQASARRRDVTLRLIDAALGRIDRGEFGYCHDCEEPIARQRLELDPTVLLCIRCAASREQRR